MPKPLPNYKDFDLAVIEPFSKIKLITLDLDGTLLESGNSKMPKKVLMLASSLKHAYQVHVTIATGRTLNGSRLLFDNLPISKNTPVILYNGGLIINGNHELLLKKTISLNNLYKVITACSGLKVKVLAYVGNVNSLGSGKIKEEVFGWSNIDRPPCEYNGLNVKWLEWNSIESVTEPSAIVIHVNKNKDIMNILCKKLNEINNINYTRGGDIYVEVSPSNCSKGIALEYIAEHILEYDRNQILAMGDNDNDVPMLKWAGIGVAVESASDLAKKNSDFVAKGVIEGAIEVLGLVKHARRLLKERVKI